MCGTDLHILKGDLPSASLAGFWDMKAGVVDEVGAGVTAFKTGDRVICSRGRQ